LSIMQLLFSLSPRNHYTNFIQPLILLLDRTYAIFMTVMLLRMTGILNQKYCLRTRMIIDDEG